MQNILVVLTAYNVEEYLAACLAPWQVLKDKHPNKIFISAVSCPFAGFPSAPQDNTRNMLNRYANTGVISRLIMHDTPITEVEARNAALSAVRGSHFRPDLIFILDGDEVYRTDLAPLEKMFDQVEREPQFAYFKVPLTNIAFSPLLALAEPFYVNRIWRTRFDHDLLYADQFGDDNGMDYKHTLNRRVKIEDRNMDDGAGLIERANVAVDHFTWLMNETSRRKIEYHNQRWGFSSYRWDIDGLHFNEEYYALRGLPLPHLHLLDTIKRGKTYVEADITKS